MIILDRDYAVCFNSFSVAVRQQRAELSHRRQKLSKHTEAKKLARVSGGRALGYQSDACNHSVTVRAVYSLSHQTI